MTDVVIRLDKSKPSSEVRGERTPSDPHYRVHFNQGRKFNGKMILLPFDVDGVLVPPDPEHMEPYAGLDTDGKPVMHKPLYDKDMLALLDYVRAKAAGAAVATGAGNPIDDNDAEEDSVEDVNLIAWLKGEARYTPTERRAAAKKRYHILYKDDAEMVRGLVLDEQIVPEDQVAPALAGYLKAKVAA
jgi:hypothetical protein